MGADVHEAGSDVRENRAATEREDWRPCPRCGAGTAPGSKFCSQCGIALVTAVPDAVTETERRDLTVLFCDMVGSTALSETLEPEDLRRILNQYHSVCAEVTQRRGGIVAQFLGDGVLAYFGYPVAHEDNARRAVSAGLDLLAAADVLAARLSQELGIELRVRVGIHTGSVIVGDRQAGADWLATGEAVNVASRIQGLAEPGSVVISEATHERAQGFFECAPLGAHSVRGHSNPVGLFRVLGETGASSRIDAAQTLGLTPLVGRGHELAQLLEHWRAARRGAGPVVLVEGEPGLGKSRLRHALTAELGVEPHQVLECRCFPDYQSSAFHPVLALLERQIGFAKDEDPASRRARLEAHVADGPGADAVPILASLLSIPLGDRQPVALPPPKLRQASLELLSGWLLARAARQPTLFVVEDLHWADPSTLELLGQLIDRPAPAGLLILLTARPEFQCPWTGERIRHLPLRRLSGAETEALVARMVGHRALPGEILRQVLAKSDGIPLFVEELTKTVLDSGLLTSAGDHYELAGPIETTSIPATIHDSLMSRLDRLGAAKSTAQLAATLGRQFRYQVLRDVALVGEEKLAEHLRHLVAAEILFAEGQMPDATFVFKHALIQDAAYRSLLRATRQEYHRRIANKLAESSPELAQTQPEVLAQHCAGAGLSDEAARHWHAAGLKALSASAHLEAISHLRNALSQLALLPTSAQRGRDQVEIHSALGLALIMTRGFAAKEVEESYARAGELCAQADELPVRVLYGIWAVPLIRGSVPTTGRLALQFERLLQRSSDPSTLLIANATLGNRAFFRGEYQAARRYLEAASALVDPTDPKGQHERLQRESGFDGLLYAPLYLSWLDGFCGFPDRAQRQWRAALALAERIGQPFVIAAAHAFGAVLGHDRGDVEAALESGEKERALGIEGGFAFWTALGTIASGWATFRKGRVDKGIELMREGMDLYQKTGANVPLPYYGSLLGEAYLGTGQREEGLKVVEEMLRMAQNNLDCNHLPELIRLKGELLAAGGELEPAEPCLQRALALSREQGALTLELRAAVSLARLQQRRGGWDRRALAELHGRFTEGFETQDLRDARALLSS